ncbi:MAG: PIG-L family deacetylase [Cyclobacteriaceae bacterium]
MKRKDFLQKGMLSGALAGSSLWASASPINKNRKDPLETKKKHDDLLQQDDEIIIERSNKGKPHTGKVLLAIQAHSDDIPLFAGGLVAKLMDEGYTGYLLRTSDDSKGDAEGNTVDSHNIAKGYGMKKAYDFMYNHHQMDNMGIQDLKGRLIFLFRLLKVDTIVCWDPWEHHEENPDHYVTARAVEAARWMAAGRADYPEHFDAGLQPHSPKVRYYFSRTPKRANRIVDITDYIDRKVEINMLNVTKGPAGQGYGKKLKETLAAEGKRLPILEENGKSADHNWVKHFVFDIDARRLNFSQVSNKKLGEKYGLGWAEWYHYISDLEDGNPNNLEKYVKANTKSK